LIDSQKVSAVALIVSLVTFFWNVFKELGLRPRVRVTMKVMVFKYDGGETATKILIYAVNFGPGTVYLNSVTLKARWRDRWRGTPKYAGVIVEDRTVYGNSDLPARLDVGQQAQFRLPYYEDSSVLKTPWRRVGITDSFDRTHWVPRKRLRRARKTYLRDFPHPASKH
jgi:hypothetical protein